MAKVIGNVSNDIIKAIKAHNLVVEKRLAKRHTVSNIVTKRLIKRKYVIKPLLQRPFANLTVMIKKGRFKYAY